MLATRFGQQAVHNACRAVADGEDSAVWLSLRGGVWVLVRLRSGALTALTKEPISGTTVA
eukprot:SM004202S15762  [mRNA]  locus=s4202:252:739:+ [translate_table: standard]